MIPALAFGLMLLAQTAPAAASSVAPPPSPAAAPAAPAAATDDPAADLDQLRQMYRDTCQAREFGAYDDMCDQLRQQVRAAEREAARARRRPKTSASPPGLSQP